MDEAIDVIVPLYNKRDFVSAALASALSQTRPPRRVIVVDDGSTDGSKQAVAAISSPLVQLIEVNRGGVSAARNIGIAASAAPVLAFLDADDLWEPDHLSTVADLRRYFPQCQVYASGYLFRDAHGVDRRPIIRGWPGAKPMVMDDYFRIASRSDPPLFSSAVAATRQAIDAVGGFPVGVPQGEDLLTWARLACRFRIAYSPRPTVVFRQPEFAQGPTRRPEAEDRVGPALLALLEASPPARRRALRRYIALWHKMRGSMFMALGERRCAWLEFRQALRFHPLSARLAVKSFLTLLPRSRFQRITQSWMLATRKPLASSR
jgi:glycosyltransferase involved in cell wall biosynthesis